MTTEQKIDVTNKIVADKIKKRHSYIEIDEVYFLELLRHSLSLDIPHKKKVVDAFPVLSQKQFDDLIETFENERVQFKEVADKYPEKIVDLVEKRKAEWIALWEVYQDEEKEVQSKNEEEDKINDIKANLGL